MTTAAAPAPAPSRRLIRLPKLFGRTPPAPPPPPRSFQDVQFVEKKGPAALWIAFTSGLLVRFDVITLPWPVCVPGQKPDDPPPLTALGHLVGLSDEASQHLLQYHHGRRLLRARIIDVLLNTGGLLLIFYVTATDLVSRFGTGGANMALDAALFLADLMLIFVASMMVTVIVMRVAGLMLNRDFAESLCVTAVLYLLVDLHRPDVLARPDHRRVLMDRFNSLVRATQLLALRYPCSDPATSTRLQRHFREMIAYIRARQGWVVTPRGTTLDDLRRDIGSLARIYLTGSYGEFTWDPQAAVERDPPPAWKSFLRGTWRAVVLVVPLVGMGYLLQHPDTLARWGVEPTPVAFLFMAWLVVTVDAILHLGFVSSVVSLAKNLKELR
jgi:hypothetical protein